MVYDHQHQLVFDHQRHPHISNPFDELHRKTRFCLNKILSSSILVNHHQLHISKPSRIFHYFSIKIKIILIELRIVKQVDRVWVRQRVILQFNLDRTNDFSQIKEKNFFSIHSSRSIFPRNQAHTPMPSAARRTSTGVSRQSTVQ